MPISFPLVKNFRATTISRAFFINAVAFAIIAALTIEVRLFVNDNSKTEGSFFYNVSHFSKVLVVIITSFSIAMIVYLSLYAFSSYGGGFIAPRKPAPWA